MNTPEAAAQPPVVRTVRDLRRQVIAWRRKGLRIGLTPTMGALHAGHLSLLDVARRHADKVVASIFVNPAQFGPNEDFDSYPRTEAEDAAKLAQAGCDLLYAPSVSEIYPDRFSTLVAVMDVSGPLCGAARPGHFDGVSTIVAKLLNQALPDVAVFGEKDWQQLAVIRRMAIDLDMPVRILGAPIVRESDGLAMSSRNKYLSAEDRSHAPRLYATLGRAAGMIRGGIDPSKVCEASAGALSQAGFSKVDYFDLRHAETLDRIGAWTPGVKARLFAAAHIGRTRLIDNIPM